MTVVAFPTRAREEYVAAVFKSGQFTVAGTLCGCVDVHNAEVPAGGRPVWTLTIPELDGLRTALRRARDDVVESSRPFTDPRIVDP